MWGTNQRIQAYSSNAWYMPRAAIEIRKCSTPGYQNVPFPFPARFTPNTLFDSRELPSHLCRGTALYPFSVAWLTLTAFQTNQCDNRSLWTAIIFCSIKGRASSTKTSSCSARYFLTDMFSKLISFAAIIFVYGATLVHAESHTVKFVNRSVCCQAKFESEC